MYQTYNIIEFLKVIKMSHSIIDTPKQVIVQIGMVQLQQGMYLPVK